jgi:integrase
MSKLTAKQVEHATAKSQEYKLSDGNGLYLRVRINGTKSWLFCYRLSGNRQMVRMTLGSIDDVSLKEARETIIKLRKQVAQGIDPRTARAAAIAENTQAITMQALFESWIEFVIVAKEITPKWMKQHETRWNRHLKSSLGKILAKDITRVHLASVLDGMMRKGIREETRRALTTLNLMLDYGLTRHLVNENPARLLKPKDFAASPNRPRDRTLSLEELRRLWKALDETMQPKDGVAKTSILSRVTVNAIKLLIVTGVRRGEICAMRWDELNIVDGKWVIPSSKTKNRQMHTVYLSKLAIELINELKPLTETSPFVFNTDKNNAEGYMHTDSLNKALWRLRKSDDKERAKDIPPPLADMKPFTIHDLRRSAATCWGEHLRVSPHVIERMLNHQPLNKLIATYQRAIYADEQKTAWLAWGEMIETQVSREPSNVIPIKKRKLA